MRSCRSRRQLRRCTGQRSLTFEIRHYAASPLMSCSRCRSRSCIAVGGAPVVVHSALSQPRRNGPRSSPQSWAASAEPHQKARHRGRVISGVQLTRSLPTLRRGRRCCASCRAMWAPARPPSPSLPLPPRRPLGIRAPSWHRRNCWPVSTLRRRSDSSPHSALRWRWCWAERLSLSAERRAQRPLVAAQRWSSARTPSSLRGRSSPHSASWSLTSSTASVWRSGRSSSPRHHVSHTCS